MNNFNSPFAWKTNVCNGASHKYDESALMTKTSVHASFLNYTRVYI